jgi:hypothetical protein
MKQVGSGLVHALWPLMQSGQKVVSKSVQPATRLQYLLQPYFGISFGRNARTKSSSRIQNPARQNNFALL